MDCQKQNHTTEEHEVKLMDLGISKVATEDRPADLTLAGMMVGSPYYVSPEQARAEKDIDWRADQYSLGASFYHMLVGSLPYDSENAMTIIAAHLSKPIPDPRDKNSDISDRSALIIGQMMQKEKEDRFESWDDAIDAIENAIDEVSGSGASTTILTSMPKELQKQLNANLNKTTKTTTKHAASPDMVEKIKGVVSKTLFGNLYIRFIILVFFLFLTFLAFFKLVKQSLYESKEKQANIKMEIYRNYKKNMLNTEQGRRKAYQLLMDIKKVGVKEKSDEADKEIKQLQTNTFREIETTRKENKRKTFKELKDKAMSLARQGKFDAALKILYDHQRQGAFSKELRREIKDLIEHIKRNKAKESGIE